MKTGVILMTALIPTKGHEALIDFGLGFLQYLNLIDNYNLHIIVSTRSFEPCIKERLKTLKDTYGNNIVLHHHADDNAPQNPNNKNDIEDLKFWGYWKYIVENFCGKVDYIFSSEKYGNDMAKILNCQHVSFDVNRDLLKIKGTNVRENLFENQNKIMNSFIMNKRIDLVFFGQESVGKTTTSKLIAEKYNGTWCPEYARQYLETVGSELTLEKMLNIAYGQSMYEQRVENSKTFVNCYDTDIFSTLGYFRLMKIEDNFPDITKYFRTKKIYLLLKDNIPFEPDILRYGGDRRESDFEFWENILKEYGLKYYIIEESNLNKRIDIISNIIDRHLELNELINFIRE